MLVVPPFERLRQEECQLEVSVGHIISQSVSKNQTGKKKSSFNLLLTLDDMKHS